MSIVSQALIVSLAFYIIQNINFVMANPMLNRPLVLCPIIGGLLGDLTTGLLLGASLEVMFLGVINVGGAQATDSTFAAVVSVSFAIMFDQPVELAIALAIPVGFVGLFFMQVRQLYSALWIPFIDNLIAQDKEKQFNFWTFFCSFSGNLLQPAILFVGLSLGGEGLQQVMDALPQYIMTGMQAAGGMLPAIGLGILINMIWEKKSVVYFLLGFVLVIYFNVPIVAMAFIAVFLAAVDLYRNQDNISLRQEIAQMRLHGVDPDSADREEEEFFG